MVGAVLISVIISLGLLGVTMLLLWRPTVNYFADAFLKRVLVDPYPENLLEMANVFAKEGPLNVMESDIRATDGAVLKRPFGSRRHYSAWNKLLFTPVYLSRLPLEDTAETDLRVVLGPRSKRPLEIKMPVIIGGIAYGIGLSKNARLALAQGADRVGTAVNAGVGPVLAEERAATKRLIIQYHRGEWGKDENTLKLADMIEIQLGYGALGPAPVSLSSQEISQDFRRKMGLGPDDGLQLHARLEEITSGEKLRRLILRLKDVAKGVPVGVKIGATHRLEAELEILTRAGADFISLDGAEAGINYGPSILADDLGLPTLPALCRAAKYLEKNRLKGKISLIISGGLVTPGHCLKALTLGADAVAVGTSVILALAHTQLTKVIPWEPPTELVFENGRYKDRLSIQEGTASVANFFHSYQQEMDLALRCLGKAALRELSPHDLTALTLEIAKLTGTEWGFIPPRPKRFFGQSMKPQGN